MRSVAVAAILLLMAARALALDITTRGGTIYRHCEVTAVEPDGIVITSTEGVARIPFEEMPEALQEQYHMNADAVAEYRKRLAAVQAAARKAADELKAKRDLAAKMEREKRRLAEQQSVAGSEQGSANPGLAGNAAG
jgi:hypothetical protein